MQEKSVITRTVEAAGGVHAPGHLGELTQIVDSGSIHPMANMLPFRNPRPHLRRARLPEALAEIMGQAYGVGGTVSDASDNDLHNRLIFEEHWQTLKKARTTEAFSHSGTQRTIPVKDLEFAYPELALTDASY